MLDTSVESKTELLFNLPTLGNYNKTSQAFNYPASVMHSGDIRASHVWRKVMWITIGNRSNKILEVTKVRTEILYSDGVDRIVHETQVAKLLDQTCGRSE